MRVELVQGRGVRWSELLAGLRFGKTGWLVKLRREEQVFRQVRHYTERQSGSV